MTPQLLEGTWEEVSEQLANKEEEFRAYGKMRLIVLPEETDAQNGGAEPTLAEMLAGRAGTFHFGDAHLSEATGKKFADLMRRKRETGQQVSASTLCLKA